MLPKNDLKKSAPQENKSDMFVIKRNNTRAPVNFDKIQRRINHLVAAPTLLEGINVPLLAKDVIAGIYDGIETREIDTYTAKLAASKGISNIDYLTLAARIVIDNHHKNTLTSFKDKMTLLYMNKDSDGSACPIIDEKFYKFIVKNQKEIEKRIDYARDYHVDYFGFSTLEKSYLIRLNGAVIERPQDLFMRVAIFMHFKSAKNKESLDAIFESYDLMSQKYFTPASPTLFNAGLARPGCISCFLLDMDDSIEGIMHNALACARISANCGGIGFSCSKIRSKGARIRGTNGTSDGPVPFLKIFQATAKAVNQGSRRNGSIAVYMDMHHPDIATFLELKKQGGNEENRCRDLFFGLWVSDLFMKRVEADETWSMFDPKEHSILNETFGEEYERIYVELEAQGRAKRTARARDIWKMVFHSHAESGTPYILFKDQINRTSNQKNIGLIRTSNLCAEIVEVCEYKDESPSEAEYACCTLSSIALPMFVEDSYLPDEDPSSRALNPKFPKNPVFNYSKLESVAKVVVRNLNNLIERTYYPTPETDRSNAAHRPLGIGVQGLADVFFKFKIPFDSPAAAELNRRIFETLYYSALKASCGQAREIYERHAAQIAKTGRSGPFTQENLPTTAGAYSTFLKGEGCPLSKGIFNFELYGLAEADLLQGHDWATLRGDVIKYGVRNSLLVACMPTASTSNILGNTECFEPRTNNIISRLVLGGEFLVVNEYLMEDLRNLNMWNEQTLDVLKKTEGSVQTIENLPREFRDRYKTVWEYKQRCIIDMAAARQPFVDQSQSMNLFISELSLSKFNTVLFHGWRQKLKTGCYYMRTCSAVMPDKFTLPVSCARENASCEMCSS